MERQYCQAVKARQWLENAGRNICSESNVPPSYFLREWKSAIASYYSDLMNFPELELELLAKLRQTASEKSGLSFRDIKRIIPTHLFREGEMAVEERRLPRLSRQGSRLNLGELHFRMPTKRYERLIAQGEAAVSALLLRYDTLLPETGLFWSLSPNIYERFQNVYPSALECFASPLNNNLTHYCSSFVEDQTFGSQGSFFDYLHEVSRLRGVINPPYTETMLQKTLEEVEAFLERGKGTFLFMYPEWLDSDAVRKLTGDCRMRVSPGLEESKSSQPRFYREHLFVSAEETPIIFDHQQGEHIYPPIRVLFSIVSNEEEVKTTLHYLINGDAGNNSAKGEGT